METGWRLIHSTRERRAHMKEKDKEGADGEEEKEDRQKINYRWIQKTQVTAIRRQRDQSSEKEDRQDPGLGPEKAWGVGRVPMWPLWTILLLVWPLGGLGSPLCPREPFYFLVAIMKMLGNKNDGTLYTPDDLSIRPPCMDVKDVHCTRIPRQGRDKALHRCLPTSPHPYRTGRVLCLMSLAANNYHLESFRVTLMVRLDVDNWSLVHPEQL
ncbi:uncharacterized protein LOC107181055 isoform X3 [Panthera tigris]|uniref:uncharacterized protein LOC107181055 isoform X3 n=1 Tax=Panthera tigris TaxID=9694 RepID=UPI001C6FBB57|nr:uncharacterized protein LOC107181055 isoform X3 [Panthera tigris]